jgi:hypothetical protein
VATACASLGMTPGADRRRHTRLDAAGAQHEKSYSKGRPRSGSVTDGHLEELAALARLADALATATAEGRPLGVHARAQALAIRLDTLAVGVRFAQEAPARDDPAPPGRGIDGGLAAPWCPQWVVAHDPRDATGLRKGPPPR